MTPCHRLRPRPRRLNGRVRLYRRVAGRDTIIGSGLFYDLQVKVARARGQIGSTRTTSVSAIIPHDLCGANPTRPITSAVEPQDNAGTSKSWPAAENGERRRWFTSRAASRASTKCSCRSSLAPEVPQLPDSDRHSDHRHAANPVAGQPVDLAVTIRIRARWRTSGCFWTICTSPHPGKPHTTTRGINLHRRFDVYVVPTSARRVHYLRITTSTSVPIYAGSRARFAARSRTRSTRR